MNGMLGMGNLLLQFSYCYKSNGMHDGRWLYCIQSKHGSQLAWSKRLKCAVWPAGISRETNPLQEMVVLSVKVYQSWKKKRTIEKDKHPRNFLCVCAKSRHKRKPTVVSCSWMDTHDSLIDWSMVSFCVYVSLFNLFIGYLSDTSHRLRFRIVHPFTFCRCSHKNRVVPNCLFYKRVHCLFRQNMTKWSMSHRNKSVGISRLPGRCLRKSAMFPDDCGVSLNGP